MQKQLLITLYLGPPGTGKSYFINKFVKEHSGQCLVLSPTWQSAKLVQGQTIFNYTHSTFTKFRPLLILKEFVILDEVFMFSKQTMSNILECIKLKESQVQQILMFGDQYQLKPPEKGYFYDALSDEELSNIKIVQFNKYYRTQDQRLIDLLEQYRITKKFIIDELINIQKISKCQDIRQKIKEGGIILVGTHKAEDYFNDLLGPLNKIIGPDGYYYRQDQVIYTLNQYQVLQDKFLFDSFEGTNMILKEYIKDKSQTNQIQNNQSQTNQSQKEQEYKKQSQNKIYITPYRKGNQLKYNIKRGEVLVINLVQGQTLKDMPVLIDSSSFFEFGSFYTAISRTNSLDNLFIIIRRGWKKIFEPDLMNIYTNFQQQRNKD